MYWLNISCWADTFVAYWFSGLEVKNKLNHISKPALSKIMWIFV